MLPLALMLLAGQGSPQETTTLPRRADADKVESQRDLPANPADPWFDKKFVATDDPTFIRNAVESGRQGIVDARVLTGSSSLALRSVAADIEKTNTDTTRRLESLAKTKGWPLPADVPNRTPSIKRSGAVRMNADFILSQIAYHEGVVAQYRAQLGGKGDPQLRDTLKAALPAYEKNLRTLLEVKP
jgi:hypothetical protein